MIRYSFKIKYLKHSFMLLLSPLKETVVLMGCEGAYESVRDMVDQINRLPRIPWYEILRCFGFCTEIPFAFQHIIWIIQYNSNTPREERVKELVHEFQPRIDFILIIYGLTIWWGVQMRVVLFMFHPDHASKL